MCELPDWYRQVDYCRVPLPEQFIPQRQWSWSEVDRIPVFSGKTSSSLELYWHILQAVHCTGWKNCSYLKQTLSRMDVLFLMSIFRLYPGIKMSFEHNSGRKNLFLSPCFCWDSRLFSREVDQKFKPGGTIVYGDPYLEFLFCHFKVFRLHAILQHAAAAVRAQSGKGPCYCYMIGRGPNSCLLGHVTGLLFCHDVKTFLPSIFNSVEFWNSMSSIVLDKELTEKDIFKELGLYDDVCLQGISFCPPKTCKSNKQTTWNTSHLHGIAWSSGKLDYDNFFAVYYDMKEMNAEVFPEGLEKKVDCWPDFSDKR